MKSGLAMFALGVIGLAAAAAMVAAPASPDPAKAKPVPIAAREAAMPKPAPQPGGMISNSTSGPAVSVRLYPPPPNPPIVAIPRMPGPADMMVASGDRELVTLRSFPSNEACDEALPRARYRHPDAFCVSTTPPPPPPEHGYLVEWRTKDKEIVGLETHPSMGACEQALASRPARPGYQGACTPKLH